MNAAMSTLSVRSAHGTYPITIGAGILNSLGETLRTLGVQTDAGIALVTDDTVANLGHADVARTSLVSAGYTTTFLRVPPGDASKSLQMCETLYSQMVQANIRRIGVVVAVGGGVVGDLAGFAAATYLRGIPYLQ
ncbi:MAG: iron-containing alcohol dehydrogenase, partial [Alicyclobacillus sp.]|nr:iron-containing alcohol dehydrogenase [Alicyclobacillus sp.]